MLPNPQVMHRAGPLQRNPSGLQLTQLNRQSSGAWVLNWRLPLIPLHLRSPPAPLSSLRGAVMTKMLRSQSGELFEHQQGQQLICAEITIQSHCCACYPGHSRTTLTSLLIPCNIRMLLKGCNSLGPPKHPHKASQRSKGGKKKSKPYNFPLKSKSRRETAAPNDPIHQASTSPVTCLLKAPDHQ